MSLYKLMVTPVSSGGNGGQKTFRLRAESCDEGPFLGSAMLFADDCRGVLARLNLQATQIENVLRKDTQTTFSASGTGDLTFHRELLESLGMRPE